MKIARAGSPYRRPCRKRSRSGPTVAPFIDKSERALRVSSFVAVRPGLRVRDTCYSAMTELRTRTLTLGKSRYFDDR